MQIRRLFTFVLCAGAAALVATASDAAVRVKVDGARGVQLVQSEKAEKGKKAKGSKETGKSQSSERGNASGELRGQDRSQQVQGLQDSGKGAQKRGERPAK